MPWSRFRNRHLTHLHAQSQQAALLYSWLDCIGEGSQGRRLYHYDMHIWREPCSHSHCCRSQVSTRLNDRLFTLCWNLRWGNRKLSWLWRRSCPPCGLTYTSDMLVQGLARNLHSHSRTSIHSCSCRVGYPYHSPSYSTWKLQSCLSSKWLRLFSLCWKTAFLYRCKGSRHTWPVIQHGRV